MGKFVRERGRVLVSWYGVSRRESSCRRCRCMAKGLVVGVLMWGCEERI